MKAVHITLVVVVTILITWVLYPHTKLEYSEERFEKGIVLETCYSPGRHFTGSGVGATSSGGVAVVTTSSSAPPTFATVFACEHGKFIIDGRETWEQLQQGDEVMIVYRDVYEYDGDQREFKDRDFVRAVVTKRKVEVR